MTVRELFEINEVHLQLLRNKGLDRITAYRVFRNSAILQAETESHRAAIRSAIEAEKSRCNGETTPEEAVRIQEKVWNDLSKEAVSDIKNLRRLDAKLMPWDQLSPEAGVVLIRSDLVEGEAEDGPAMIDTVPEKGN